MQALAALVDEHNGDAKQQEQDDLSAMADLLDDLEDLCSGVTYEPGQGGTGAALYGAG